MEANTCSCSDKIILGSSSIARRKILAEMGYKFTIMTADVDEKSFRKASPEGLMMALAEAKADAIISKLQTTNNEKIDESTILIAADTEIPDEIIEKLVGTTDSVMGLPKGLTETPKGGLVA